MINAAFAPLLFWDGRAEGRFEDPEDGTVLLPDRAALESQAVGPPLSDVEMGHIGIEWEDVLGRLEEVIPLALARDLGTDLESWIAGRDYPALFEEVFGSPGVTAARLGMAIATYERTLISDRAPIDDFLAGDPTALTRRERDGFNLFNTRARCNICHTGPLFTNNGFFNIGVRPSAEDLGREAVTGNPDDRGRFKVPSLRNVGLRAPYFHNGGMSTLRDVVEFYNRGGDFAEDRSGLIVPLGLTGREIDALVAFLEGALTDPRVASETAPFDRPNLYRASDDVPSSFGAGSEGADGFIPRFIALEPPQIGNPNFTLGLDRGLGGAPAFLVWDLARSEPGTELRGVPWHLAISPLFRIQFTGSLLDSGPGNGFSSVVGSIPNDAALSGLDLFMQWIVLDPTTPSGLAVTSGIEMTIFE